MNTPLLPNRPRPARSSAWPAAPAGARTDQPSESTRRRWERMGRAIDAARSEGQADGLHQGHVQGWRWGLACGLAGGVLLAGVAWGLWLTWGGVAP